MAKDETQVVTMALEAFNDRRWFDFAAAYSPDAVIRYPQSGERIVGRENIARLVRAFPVAPRFIANEIHSGGDMVVVHVDIDYGSDPPWKGAFLYWLRRGTIRREVAYFAAPFEPPAWRAPFTDVTA